MRAVVRERYGSPDVVIAIEKPKPTPRADELLVQLRYRRSLTPDGSYAFDCPDLDRVYADLCAGRRDLTDQQAEDGQLSVVAEPAQRLGDTLARLLVPGRSGR